VKSAAKASPLTARRVVIGPFIATGSFKGQHRLGGAAGTWIVPPKI
jgi:hypothetical protein